MHTHVSHARAHQPVRPSASALPLTAPHTHTHTHTYTHRGPRGLALHAPLSAGVRSGTRTAPSDTLPLPMLWSTVQHRAVLSAWLQSVPFPGQCGAPGTCSGTGVITFDSPDSPSTQQVAVVTAWLKKATPAPESRHPHPRALRTATRAPAAPERLSRGCFESGLAFLRVRCAAGPSLGRLRCALLARTTCGVRSPVARSQLSAALFNSELPAYTGLVDVRSFTDYFLLTELTKNVDAYECAPTCPDARRSTRGSLDQCSGPIGVLRCTLAACFRVLRVLKGTPKVLTGSQWYSIALKVRCVRGAGGRAQVQHILLARDGLAEQRHAQHGTALGLRPRLRERAHSPRADALTALARTHATRPQYRNTRR
jgi:hypothetical protein